MDTILFLSHTEQDGTLSRAALEALTAARALAEGAKGQLILGVFGEQTGGAAAQVAGSGAQRALAVTSPDLAAARYASDAAAAEALVRA
ncbi:MAG TPA: electron transfer flavoprotein subunit alpha, partial [Anaeromyxobacteraceae bacterium]